MFGPGQHTWISLSPYVAPRFVAPVALACGSVLPFLTVKFYFFGKKMFSLLFNKAYSKSFPSISAQVSTAL